MERGKIGRTENMESTNFKLWTNARIIDFQKGKAVQFPHGTVYVCALCTVCGVAFGLVMVSFPKPAKGTCCCGGLPPLLK